MSITNQQGIIVGLEVSPSSFKSVFLNENGEIINSKEVSVNPDQNLWDQLVEFINSLKTEVKDLQKIGIAVPGLVNYQTNQIVFSTHLPQQTNSEFVSKLQTETQLDIIFENDANAAAYGEYLLGAGRGNQNIFYITLGTGVGGALIFNGELWRGVSGFAGEFGHITIDSDGLKLEDVASSANIIRRTKNRFYQDSTSSLFEIGEENITIADIVREANNGDEFAQLMLERTGMYVGTGVAGVINLLNIEKIVVGGDVMEAKDFVLNAIIERANELSFSPSFETTEILAGELNGLAAASGVALLTKLRK